MGCTIEAVWLATEGGPRRRGHPFHPLSELFEEFVGNGGEVWLFVGAAKVVEEIVNGAKAVAFA